MRSLVEKLIINHQTFVLRNYGDGWDVYHCYDDDDGFQIHLLEEGCATRKQAIKIAEEYANA